MAVWLLLLLALNIQGHSLGDQRNETNISGNLTTQLTSRHTTSSAVLQATTSNPPKETPKSLVYSSTTIPSTSTSIMKTENKITTTAPQTTTGSIPKTTATPINSSVETTAKEDRNLPNFTHHREKKVTSPLPVLRISSTNSTTSRIPTGSTNIPRVTIEITTIQNNIDDSKQSSSKTEYENTEGTTTENIRTHTNTPEGDPIDGEWSTTTETESDWELETSTSEESSTMEEGITESTDAVTENTDVDDFSTTDLPEDLTTTDSSLESTNEDSYEEISSLRTTQDLGKTQNHASQRTAPCPPGRAGLACRRAEARRTADECSGGNCEKCRSCNNTAASDWPHCCRKNFRCCSELALACQQCDQPTLREFCTMHFKRCF
ncbi:mucin-5AC-like [Ischnura elegans]|uniref:mucin-5AC-like n=1 Tax=Ischnura elegans TaxID=197161 RepID=UPI001ED8A8D2|nr:mucin-5AC-like [Ischnura elegans]